MGLPLSDVLLWKPEQIRAQSVVRRPHLVARDSINRAVVCVRVCVRAYVCVCAYISMRACLVYIFLFKNSISCVTDPLLCNQLMKYLVAAIKPCL